MIDILTAILSLNPNAKCDVYAEDISTINWRNNTTPVDASLIAAEQTRLQAEYDNAQYARDREQAYPPMADQLDDIFHNGVDGWKATIQAVKDANPKPV
jgi:hypothetical protein